MGVTSSPMESAQSLGERECKEAEGSVRCHPKERCGTRRPQLLETWAGFSVIDVTGAKWRRVASRGAAAGRERKNCLQGALQ